MNRPASPSAPGALSARAAEAAPEAAVPDAQRLQGQLAGLIEQKSGAGTHAAALRPWLEFIRTLLNARAIALLPAPSRQDFTSSVVTMRGVLASQITSLTSVLEPGRTSVLPAPELGSDAYTIAVAVQHEGEDVCWLLALLAVPNARDLQAFVVLLQALAGYVLYRHQRALTGRSEWALERTGGVMEILRRAGSELDFDKACRIAVDDLRDFLGCERVGLGIVQRGNVHVRAMSGVAQLDPKSVAHHPWEEAMREALDLGEPIHFTAGQSSGADTAAHEVLAADAGCTRLVTLPLARERGAVVLAWQTAPDGDAARVLRATEPFVRQLFELLLRARPNPVVFAARRTWERFSAGRRRAIFVSCCALAALLAFPFRYEVKADCRLAPKVKRVVAAPFAGELRRSTIQPGDAVKAGDILAELDQRELKMREAELTAGRERAMKQRDKALRNDGEGADFAAAQIADFEARSVGEELALLRRKLALLEVKAPIDGIVVAGDLRRAAGQPVEQGQLLFEVAPLDAMLVEIDVPDREVSRVRTGQPVRVRLESFGGRRWDTAIERLHPQSEQRDGANVFIAEAPIDHGTEALDLRPGMRGRAAISTSRWPLIWILGHKLWDWVITTLFW